MCLQTTLSCLIIIEGCSSEFDTDRWISAFLPLFDPPPNTINTFEHSWFTCVPLHFGIKSRHQTSGSKWTCQVWRDASGIPSTGGTHGWTSSSLAFSNLPLRSYCCTGLLSWWFFFQTGQASLESIDKTKQTVRRALASKWHHFPFSMCHNSVALGKWLNHSELWLCIWPKEMLITPPLKTDSQDQMGW